MIEVSETIMDARTVFSYSYKAFEEATQKVKYLGRVRPLGLREKLPAASLVLTALNLTWSYYLVL